MHLARLSLAFLLLLASPQLYGQEGLTEAQAGRWVNEVCGILLHNNISNDSYWKALELTQRVLTSGTVSATLRGHASRLHNIASKGYVRANLNLVTGVFRHHLEQDLSDFTYRSPQGRVIRVRIPERMFYSGEIQSIQLADDVPMGSLKPTSNAPGSVGIPLVINVLDSTEGVAGRVNTTANRTAIVSPVNPLLRTIPVTVTFQRNAKNEYVLTVQDPRRTTEATIGGQTVPLRRNLAAPIAQSAERILKAHVGPRGFKDPQTLVERAGIYYPEPHLSAKELIVLIHGMNQDPHVYRYLAQQISEDPILSRRFQVAVAYYPTGLDPNVSAALLTRDLVRDQKVLGFEKVVLVGHSLGGVVTKVITSRPELIEQLPFVEKAVFVAAPLEGSPLSRVLTSWPLIQSLIYRHHLNSPKSVEALDPDGEFIRELKKLEPRVEHHVIAGDRIRLLRDLVYTLHQPGFATWKLHLWPTNVRIPLPSTIQPNDGMVSVKSATSPRGATSQSVFHENHGDILTTKETFEALKRILTSPPSTARPASRAASMVRTEAEGAGKFAAAYLLKEAFKGRNALADLKTPGFWGSLALFTVAARSAEKFLPFKQVLPLAAGMAALQVLSGNFSLKDLAISSGAFLAAGAGVNLLADRLIFPVLFATPPGRIAAWVYTVGKLAVTLYAGEKLEAWIRSMFAQPQGANETVREGVQQKIDAMMEN